MSYSKFLIFDKHDFDIAIYNAEKAVKINNS